MDKCRKCSQYRNCRDSFASWIFFIIGLLATVALRVVTVLISLNPAYGKIAWYVGVAGFFVFFVYKFRVNQSRSRLISRLGLVDKVRGQGRLTPEEYSLLGSILCSLSSKKERINYFFIFGLSAIALILAVYFDFFKKP